MRLVSIDWTNGYGHEVQLVNGGNEEKENKDQAGISWLNQISRFWEFGVVSAVLKLLTGSST